jgi:hypothetical protein
VKLHLRKLRSSGMIVHLPATITTRAPAIQGRRILLRFVASRPQTSFAGRYMLLWRLGLARRLVARPKAEKRSC